MLLAMVDGNLASAPRYDASEYAVSVQLPQPLWLPDSSAAACVACEKEFTVTSRRVSAGMISFVRLLLYIYPAIAGICAASLSCVR